MSRTPKLSRAMPRNWAVSVSRAVLAANQPGSPLVTGILARVFGLTHFGALYGVVFLSHQVGSFFGAWMGGLVFAAWGNYNFAWGALIVIGVTAFTLQWLMDEKPPTARAVALAGT